MLSQQEILEELSKNLTTRKEQYGVKRIVLFGSYARGEPNVQREPKVYLEDIYAAVVKIENFTNRLSYDEFIENELVADAVIKNILVIGEATKNIPKEIRSRNQHIVEKDGRDERYDDHGYFSINNKIIRDVVHNKIPILKEQTQKMLHSE